LRILHVCVISLAACIAAQSAQAGDGPVYKAPPVIRTNVWSGCYIGAEGGGVWGLSRQDAVGGPTITGDFGTTGSLIGGTVGCNYQTDNFVLGVEDDMSWTNANGGTFDLPPSFDPNTFSQTYQNWIDTLRLRAGLPWDRWLGYVTGGAAFAGTGVSVCNTLGCVNDSATRIGWTAGAGVEYALMGQWTLKVEYLYANFGSASYVNPATTVGGFTFVTRNVTLSDNIARAGINYKFFGP